MLANILFGGQPQWRSHEFEGAQHAFGEVANCSDATSRAFQTADSVRWFPPSENCGPELHAWMLKQRALSSARFHINDATHYGCVHDKVECFHRWRANGIPTPPFFDWQPGGFQPQFDPPYLLRVNNSVAGMDSWLVREPSELPGALAAVEACSAARCGAINRLVCTKFINTQGSKPLNVSYRIIVAGGKVVTGYARVSDPGDWVAVTNKFHAGIADSWLYYNRHCQEIMVTHGDLLASAVGCLGLNHQGVDVIEDGTTGDLYFLEVQTTYDAGFIGAGPYLPPYYNPYNPKLVQFISDNKREIETQLPLYYHLWLDKVAHFRTCYANLAATRK